ncbi:MAG: peptidyl-prolyl cis-trans isomerase [Candidatus Omnitrophota bacterium]|nr:peptidyl-prolyl cis-trans isomerase [Candidatus Omnitrophota bacterium]
MSRSRFIAVLAAIFVACAAFGCKGANIGKPQAEKKEAAVKGGKIVAEVGKEKITLEEMDKMIGDIPKQYQAMALTNKAMFLDSIINQKLLYGEALKQNVEKNAEVKKQIEEATKEIVIREYLKKEIEQKVAVSDADAKAYYDGNKDKFKEPEKIKVFHILVDNEAEAKDILAKLKAGADFAALAKEKSKDASKENGGELGFIAKGQTVPEFEQAAFALQPGQLSDVVKTQFGYHIIKVNEKQPEKELSFDEVKDQLKQMLLSQKQKDRFDSLLKELKDRNKVVIYKDVLMPPVENKPAEAPVAPVAPTQPK